MAEKKIAPTKTGMFRDLEDVKSFVLWCRDNEVLRMTVGDVSFEALPSTRSADGLFDEEPQDDDLSEEERRRREEDELFLSSGGN